MLIPSQMAMAYASQYEPRRPDRAQMAMAYASQFLGLVAQAVGLGFTIITMSVLLQRFYGVNVWAIVGAYLRSLRDKARELDALRRMWAIGGE